MNILEASIVIFLIALSLSFLLRGVWKKARANREEPCCRGRCGCAVSKKAAAARR
ncbi:MAG: hypothetical protein NTW41_04640 [Verrucomicrobia bacterium]|nr:hypothetical protein [Verrucomicrobiota bacterium]